MTHDRPLSSDGSLLHPETMSRTPLYVNSRARPEEFRVALICPSDVPRWINSFVRLANSDSWITVTAFPALDAEGISPVRLPADIRALLALERIRFRHGEGMLDAVPISPAYCANVLSGTSPSSRLVALGRWLETLRPDLVILLGTGFEADKDCCSSDWDCWRLDSSITDESTAGISLLAPVLRQEFATAVALELEDQHGEAFDAATSWGATQPGSFHLQREHAFRKMPALLLRLLRRIAAGESPQQWPHTATLRMGEPPEPLGPYAGVRALAISLPHTARWQWRKRHSEQPWFVALRNEHTQLDPEQPRINGNKLVVAPKGTYWADPCAVGDGDRSFLFVEEVSAKKKKGVITCIELCDNGNAVRLGVALDEPWHLSYPQPFLWEGHWYMTVESKAAQRVILYRAESFPLRWKRVVDLIEGRKCVDPTLYHHDGKWYLFVNASESGGSTWDELFLFVSDDLYGPFQPHPGNPILSDVRRARPAGRIFSHGGRLIRPSQDCARSYGAAIVFNEVIELSPARYSERPLARLDPSWSSGLDGCHTYNVINGMEVIDARGTPPRSMPRVVVLDPDPGPAHTESK